MQTDYLIVGSGLTGATIVRTLADAGRDVQVVEKRQWIGGNVADGMHENGIRYNFYGPHYFRTNSDELWEYVQRFAVFHPHRAIVKSFVDGKCENWPVSRECIDRLAGKNAKPASWHPQFRAPSPRNFEEASLDKMPRVIYEKFVRGYTEKQWGVCADSLNASLASRFDVREDNSENFSTHKYQGVPRDGYTNMMVRMLSGVPVHPNYDWLEQRGEIKVRRLTIFTGALDAFFNFDLGPLQYRAQARHYITVAPEDLVMAQRQCGLTPPCRCYVLPCGQVNFPSPDVPYIRAIEWKHMMPPEQREQAKGTLLTYETPYTPTDPDQYEYPFPDAANEALARRYRERVPPKTLICGRLGENKYLDMDQAIGRALQLAKQILKR